MSSNPLGAVKSQVWSALEALENDDRLLTHRFRPFVRL